MIEEFSNRREGSMRNPSILEQLEVEEGNSSSMMVLQVLQRHSSWKHSFAVVAVEAGTLKWSIFQLLEKVEQLEVFLLGQLFLVELEQE